MRELEHEQPATGFQHAVQARERALLVRDVAQPKADRHAVEARGANGSASASAEHVVDVAGEPAFNSRVAALSSIAALMSVTTTRPVRPTAARARREIAAAGGDVERLLARPQARLRDREALPQPVQAADISVVHQVVARGDGVEDAAHAGLLSPRGTCS